MQRMAVIMAGGSGERFWPVSRRLHPKQLLRLTDPRRSLLKVAVDRIAPLVPLERVLIATGTHLDEPVRQAALVPPENVLAEPDRRNTLGCLCWVVANLIARDQRDTVMAILTADHDIGAEAAFRDSVDRALRTALRTGGLVTLGIRPLRPDTAFGYIEFDPEASTEGGACRALRFREKPQAAIAAQYVASGRYLWNSGMFFWTVDGFLRELSTTCPEAERLIHPMADALRAGNAAEAERYFRDLPNQSIDYALMEEAEDVWVLPANFPWDDVGSWDALQRTLERDEEDNVVLGDAVVEDCHDCIIYVNTPGVVVGAVGCSHLTVVVSEDAVLVCPVDEVQRVKEIVKRLKERGDERI